MPWVLDLGSFRFHYGFMTTGRPRGRAVRGAELRRRREEAGLRKTQLARASNLSARYVADLEKERYGASIEMLHRLAAALGCTAADLLQDPDGHPVTTGTAA